MASFDSNETAAAFSRQAEICRLFGSPFYAGLLARMAEDLAVPGPMRALLADWQGPALRAALPLRVMAALHRMVLSGQAAELAAIYARSSEPGMADVAWPEICARMDRGVELLQAGILKPPQTNEVGRSAAFLAGMLSAAREYRLPLSLREIGSSAGLNLFWDQYRYDFGSWHWGDADSSVLIQSEAEGTPPADFDQLRLSSRRGCDLHPIDLEDSAARLDLESYVWADQPGRLATLRAAIELVRAEGLRVEASGAAEWVAGRMAEREPGATTVLYHSVMWAYMSDREQAEIENLILAAGRCRDRAAPLIWMSLEDAVDRYRAAPELRLRYRSWPAGTDRILAQANPHGTWLRWTVD